MKCAGSLVIFITARAEDDARAHGMSLGAVGYLVKPFNPAMLADEVERVIEPEERTEPETGD